jgi:hypothetical protein|tara:strand:- start:3042 stop:3368 length:327 start_codon:yes stop_codon:yes gene_type:complete
MEKFLSIPVLDANGANNQEQLVSIKDVVSVTQTTTTAVTLAYINTKIVTLNFAVATSLPLLADSIQNAMSEALKTGWTNVATQYFPVGSTTAPTTGIVTNPLSSITIN